MTFIELDPRIVGLKPLTKEAQLDLREQFRNAARSGEVVILQPGMKVIYTPDEQTITENQGSKQS